MTDHTLREARPFDIVLWGATGFTGRLVAEYLATHAPKGLRWALAGRSRAKLEEIRATIPAAHDVPILVGDAADRASLDAIARQTKVVCTTVGPFAKYGTQLVAACAANGTDCCDITGEVQFIRRTIDAHHEEAKRTGARIVHCCGFDSIPSDLGAHAMHEHAKEHHGKPLADVRYVVVSMRGGASGGTVASMLNLLDEGARDRSLLRLFADPYALSPDRAHDLDLDGPDQRGIRWDDDLDLWTAPFVMAAINTRIVRRSNALFGHGYGKHFRYAESMSLARGIKGLPMALGFTAGIGAFLAAAMFPPTRKLVERVVPAPGEGPSEAERKSGYFRIRLVGTLEGDATTKLLGRVEGIADPGYGETAKMLGESALCLALDPKREGFAGGVLTPATAMGAALRERLVQAGMTFSVEELKRGS